ncbi:MAG: c-type cytochrome [Isosphaeraceae bacterium]|nr:c-type cytochrome [Isosphaeraceae bacterium]
MSFQPWFKQLLRFAAAFCLAIGCARGIPAADEPDDDEAAHELAVARQALRDNCMICHADEMITTQRLTPAQWKTEVEKMIGWGSPLPKEQTQPLIDFLAREYSDRKPAASLDRMPFAEIKRLDAPTAADAALARGNAQRGAERYATNCASCHGADGQGAELGPNLVEKPVLLRPDEFHEVTEHGRRRMPAFEKLLPPDQAENVRAWLQQRRFTLAPAR